MRRILVDAARRKRPCKHGGGPPAGRARRPRTGSPSRRTDLLALDDALTRLAARRPAQGRSWSKLRFFAGLTVEEAATPWASPAATADRYWAYARAWLFADLRATNPPADEHPTIFSHWA